MLWSWLRSCTRSRKRLFTSCIRVCARSVFAADAFHKCSTKTARRLTSRRCQICSQGKTPRTRSISMDDKWLKRRSPRWKSIWVRRLQTMNRLASWVLVSLHTSTCCTEWLGSSSSLLSCWFRRCMRIGKETRTKAITMLAARKPWSAIWATRASSAVTFPLA